MELMCKLWDGSIQQAQRSQTIDATNHFLHVSCHGLDPAAQPIVLGDHPVLLQSEPCEINQKNIINKVHFRSCRAIQAGVDGIGGVTQGPFYLCISINNLVFGKPLKWKFVLLLPNDCSGRWWESRAAACPAGRYGQWRVQTHTNVFWNGKWGYFTGPHNVKDLFEG